MNDIEKVLLQKAIEVHGAISEVAKIFKVDRTTIYRKLKKHSLSEKTAGTFIAFVGPRGSEK
jgi:transcriptional regulator of acetoin/glycerol metabolism